MRQDPAYVPEFVNVPIVRTDLPVPLSDEEHKMLDRLCRGGVYGRTPGEVLRYVFHSWWISRFMEGPKHFKENE